MGKVRDMTKRWSSTRSNLTTTKRAAAKAARRFPVDYDDEVTAEQVAAIDKLVAPEFAHGDWITVESE